MPRVDALVRCPVHDSFAVQQVAGMFDLAVPKQVEERFSVELPGLDEDWDIGVIVGPSGSGKTTIARKAFGELLYTGHKWPDNRSVIDCFGERPIKETTHALTSVGFSSPPAWIKPYGVLSNGEKFRCDLVQALLRDGDVVAFDEFTSVVDRTVAKIGSAAVTKAIRSGKTKKRFVAVTCHYDILEWLEPAWVVDMATCELARRRLRRPEIRLQIFRCHRSVWQLFKRHHYLSATLHNSARCYVALHEGQPVAFCAMQHMYGNQVGRWRISRIVVLPDYHGVGIGGRVIDEMGSLYRSMGHDVLIVTAHPAMIAALKRSPLWELRHVQRGSRKLDGMARELGHKSTMLPRARVSFRYVPRASKSA